MLLIDGVKYELWSPQSEDEFEQVVKEHATEIFGEQSIYLDRKQKLKSLSGIGSIPDGLVIIFGDAPEWHIVEVELSSHDPYQHVVPQVDKFINAVDNPTSRNKIIDALYDSINDELLKVKTRQLIGQGKDIHKFLSDLIKTPPTITIIIEKDTDQLEEALRKYTQKKVIEFQTLTREGTEGLVVHAHLFEPLYEVEKGKEDGGGKRREGVEPVTVKDLIEANIIQVGQVIHRLYKGQRFEGKVLDNGSIELAHTGEKFNSLSTAAKPIAGSVDGWTWWHTTRANGTECLLDEFRKEYKSNPSP